MNLFRRIYLAVLALTCAGCAPLSPISGSCDASPNGNRGVVIAFYTEGLVGLNPRSAFERYVANSFIEHKPDIPLGTKEAAVTFLEGLIKQVPNPRWTILRTVAEGDLVFLHASFSPAEGAPTYAIADLFRLNNCKIVEHWDVVAGPPSDARNPNSRF